MGWLDFVSDLTGDSSSKSSEAGHDFRDDSGARTGSDSKHFESAPDWVDTELPSGQSLVPDGKS